MTSSPTREWTVATVARRLLMLAVALGLTAMHVMAAGTSSDHGYGAVEAQVVAMMTPVHAGVHDVPPTTAPSAGGADQGGGVGDEGHGGHGGVGACILFAATGLVLLAALVVLVLGLRRSWRTTGESRRRAVACRPDRGPPPGVWRPRIALCVIRV